MQFEPPPSRTNFHQNKGAILASTLKEELLPTYHGEFQASTLKEEYSPSESLASTLKEELSPTHHCEIVTSTLKDEFPPPYLTQKDHKPLPFMEDVSPRNIGAIL